MILGVHCWYRLEILKFVHLNLFAENIEVDHMISSVVTDDTKS